MEFNKFVLFEYFSTVILIYAVLNISSEAIPQENSKSLAYTASPFDQELTTTEYATNVTLDIQNDTLPGSVWQMPRKVSKFFEYYESVEQLRNESSNSGSCAHVSKDSADKLENVAGVWAACQDNLAIHDDCLSLGLRFCFPNMKYAQAYNGPKLRTVYLNIFLQGLAKVRLSLGSSTQCFDFSLRNDTFSPCQYVPVEAASEAKWTKVKSQLDGYSHLEFTSFTVQLYARFKGDVALVDKIEATEFRLCGNDDEVCGTTASGPTRGTTAKSTTSTASTLPTETETSTDVTEPRQDSTTTGPNPNGTSSLSVSLFGIIILTVLSVTHYFQ